MNIYYSKYRQLRLIVKASKPVNNGGNLSIIPGKQINFMNGKFSTDDQDEINFIENHPLYKNHTIVKVKEPVSEKVETIKNEAKKVGSKSKNNEVKKVETKSKKSK